jgi:hypothetical protein
MTKRKPLYYLQIGQPVKIFPVNFPTPVANLKDPGNYSDYLTLSIKKDKILKKSPEKFEWGHSCHTPDMVISSLILSIGLPRGAAYYP